MASGAARSSRNQERSLFALASEVRLADAFAPENHVTLYHGNCIDLLLQIPNESAQLVITSPPYNIGKSYEKRLDLDRYVEQQSRIIAECIRILKSDGSICWQVGNFVQNGAIVPLDTMLYPVFARAGLQMRNRIIWSFNHGLHCSRRFSGRYEVIIWFTKTGDYHFDLDAVRVPQKYPGKKYFKGEKVGQYSCNPKGKNPGDFWTIPNVKHNHVEKTEHPCQFPVELVERLVLSLTRKDSLVVDPFVGSGTTLIAALRHGRRSAGAEVVEEYCRVARNRITLESQGLLRTRPMGQELYQPNGQEAVAKPPHRTLTGDIER